MTIWPTQNWTLVCDYELTIKPTIKIYISINVEFQTTCQAEALFFDYDFKTKMISYSHFNIATIGRWAKIENNSAYSHMAP